MPVGAVRRSCRKIASTTPPWHDTTISSPACSSSTCERAEPTRRWNAATVSPPGKTSKCGSPPKFGDPNFSTYAAKVAPSRSGPGSCSPKPAIWIGSAVPIAGPKIRAVSNARLKLLAISTPPSSSPVLLRRSRRRPDCSRPSSDRPLHVRYPPITRSTVTCDSPWRTRTSRVAGRAGDVMLLFTIAPPIHHRSIYPSSLHLSVIAPSIHHRSTSPSSQQQG